MKTPDNLKYTTEHEWVGVEGGMARVGITDYAQGELGDIVFVELPEPGTQVKQGAVMGTIEAVKTVSDLYAPVSGKVVAVNASLADRPELVNQSPYGEGWMIQIEVASPGEMNALLDARGYTAHVGGGKVRFPYIPRGAGEEDAMLAAIGVRSFDDLVRAVPERFRLRKNLDLPAPQSEFEIARWMDGQAERNAHGGRWRSFLGAGSYDHFVPAAVDHVSFRSEFYTAYTPYQPEVSQGTLTAIFEFQTMISELTGMEVANASLYDGASALAEAALLAVSVTKRPRLLVAGPLHPHYAQVLATYCRGLGVAVMHDPAPEGIVDRAWLRGALGAEPAAVIAQTPNFLGVVEDLSAVFAEVRDAGARSICVFEPHALGLYRTPGELGADLAVGEGLSLGTPPCYGGPALGLFTARQEFVRLAPGRLIGETVDREGRRAYVMTLQTREQHIRREKATSNICTNQGLLALRATIYLSLLGPQGLREVAVSCLERAHFAAERLGALPGFRLLHDRPFFHEFVLQCPRPAREVVQGAARRGVLPGVALDRFPAWRGRGERLLHVCVTEKHDRSDLEALVEAVGEAARG